MSRVINHDEVDLEGWILSAKGDFSSKNKESVRFFSKWFIIRGGTLHYYPNVSVKDLGNYCAKIIEPNSEALLSSQGYRIGFTNFQTHSSTLFRNSQRKKPPFSTTTIERGRT